MNRPILVNDLPYSMAEENPLESLETTLALSVDDWGASRAMSWVWGIVCGWDEAMAEQAVKHRWSSEAVARLRRLHAAYEALHGEEPNVSEESE